MKKDLARVIAVIIHDPFDRIGISHTTKDFLKANRAGALVTRVRACVSMNSPISQIEEVVEDIVNHYPDIEAWVLDSTPQAVMKGVTLYAPR